MAIQERGENWYGDSAADIRAMFAHKPGDPVKEVRDVVCECGGRAFSFQADDDVQEAVWFCRDCDAQYLFHARRIAGHYEGDPDGNTECINCPCTTRGGSYFELAVGVTLYDNSADVDWAFIGCRCVACGMLGYLAEWHRIEYPYSEFFAHMDNKQIDEPDPPAGGGGM